MIQTHGVNGLTSMQPQPQTGDYIQQFENEMRLKIKQFFNLPGSNNSSSSGNNGSSSNNGNNADIDVDTSLVLTLDPMEKQYRYIM